MEQKKHYKTEKDIDFLHDVKFSKIETPEDYEEAFEYWNKEQYLSYNSERLRIALYKKNIRLWATPKNVDNIFKTVVNSYMYQIDKKLNIDDINKQIYFFGNGLVYKIVILDNDKFISTFIHKDIIYTDKFILLKNKKQNKFKLKVVKSMKVPFSLNHSSLKGATIRVEFMRRSKKYVKKIMMGVYSVDN